MSKDKTSTDVLIVGAGPTGLTLALELTVQNVAFRIIDSKPVRSDKSRAFILHARSQELLSRHDTIIPKLLEEGMRNLGVRMFVDKKYRFELDFSDAGKDHIGFVDTEYPTPLMVSQAKIEAVMEARLLELGTEIERSLIAEKLSQESSGVTLTARNSSTEHVEEIQAKYIVGCDGAHSFIRKALDIPFIGSAYDSEYIHADVRLKWQFPYDRLTMFMARGFMMCIPQNNNVFRVVTLRPSHPSSIEPTMDDFRKALKVFVPGECEISDPVWLSNYRISHRIADRFQKGRCFLAGDAAHIHSPAGGQGMNTGIQDSINLGWKLGQVLRGEVGSSLLDSYHDERYRVGTRLLTGTDWFFEFLTTTNIFYTWIRNWFVANFGAWMMSSPERRANQFRFISQLGVRYRHSSISSTDPSYKGRLRGGDRAPDGAIDAEGTNHLQGLFRGPGHHLLLFSGMGKKAIGSKEMDDMEKTWKKTQGENWFTIHHVTSTAIDDNAVDKEGIVHKRYGFENPGFVLVRPDGYIASIGTMSALLSKEKIYESAA